jgi:hypothetical protein
VQVIPPDLVLAAVDLLVVAAVMAQTPIIVDLRVEVILAVLVAVMAPLVVAVVLEAGSRKVVARM